jgi:hypothetical protein
MAKKFRDLSEVVTPAIENAFFFENYTLKFYEYLKSKSIKRAEVSEFLTGNLCLSITHQIDEIEMYLSGSQNLFESYDWMGRDRAKQLKDYLNSIILDAKQYEIDRKPGRKPSKVADK